MHDECLAAGAAPALTAALLAHAGDAEVQLQACGALRALSLSPAGREACAVAVPALAAALEAHSAVLDVAEQACAALRSISCCSPGLKACWEARCAPAIAAALARHGAAAAGLAEDACMALFHIVRCGDSEAKGECVGAGAIPALVSALLAHTAHAGVAQQACLVLCHFARVGCELCVTAGAAAAIVAALAAHAGDAGVAEAACLALLEISVATGNDVNAWLEDALAGREPGPGVTGRAACVAAGAIPALVSALRMHAGCAKVVGYATEVLSFLLDDDEIGEEELSRGEAARNACVAAGGAQALVAALRAQAASAYAVEQLCHTLHRLARESPEGRMACVEAGAAPAIAAALKAHAGKREVARTASTALRAIQ